MKYKRKKSFLPLILTAAGALAGLLYYYLAVCADGLCPISSSPLLSMGYMAVIGWLLSGLFRKERKEACNT